MKVAYLLGSLNRGGTETLLLDIFKNAAQNKLEAICFYRKTGSLESEFLKCGVEMIFLPEGRNYLKYLKKLRAEFKRNNVNIVHAQQPFDAFNARIACMRTSVKVVLSLHGYYLKENLLFKTVLRLILPFTSKNIFVSFTLMDYFVKKFKLNIDKQTVVYNGISLDKFQGIKEKKSTQSIQNIRVELGLSPDSILFCTVGNFIIGRDQYTLCKFINLLKEEYTDFYMLFIGRRVDKMPDYYDDCVKYCEQNNLNKYVRFLGVRNDVPELLPQMDAFLYSTDHDTFGIAVIEAMACGIPVFVNDWDVIKEITNEGRFVTLYKTKDEMDLLREIVLFLHDKSLFIQKASKAAKFVKEKYSIENHIEWILKEYENLK